MIDIPTVSETETANARTLAIETIAKRFNLPLPLVVAIARTESGLNRYAMRCEPAYRWLWDVQKNAPFEFLAGDRFDVRLPPKRFPSPSGISQLTEWLGQSTSWGVMQVMGALARQYGFRGQFPSLSDPMLGAEIGCRHLVELRDRYLNGSGWRGVIAAYNAGSPRLAGNGQDFLNQEYVELVLKNGAVAIA